MSLAFNLVTTSIKGLTRILCQIDSETLGSVPLHGPLILVCNHINFLDAPVMYSHLQPRTLTGFAKSETWDNPVLGPLFTLWGAIPLQRGEADHAAIRQAWQALDQGKILAITPDGTRSNDGRLKRGHPGVVSLALHARAPLLPLVYYGQESFRGNLRRLKRTAFHIRVGQPFTLAPPPGRLTPELRQAITDEIMYQLAGLLPPDYRGVYGDMGLASTHYLQFVESAVRDGTSPSPCLPQS
jgi:1-acyl-sn-glycerol-3-phosphate acyltransferase